MQSERVTLVGGKPMVLLGPELRVGDAAPDFSAVDGSLKEVTLASTGRVTRIFSVLPSLDTPVCDASTKRFNDESAALPGVDFYTVSMDLPYAQTRFCNSFAVDYVKMLSDYRDGAFGQAWGTLIRDLRLHSRAIFVVGPDNRIKYLEYVPELNDHPNYDAALAAATERTLIRAAS
jgi:thiol peroxidase